jgi:hypothetical protein
MEFSYDYGWPACSVSEADNETGILNSMRKSQTQIIAIEQSSE